MALISVVIPAYNAEKTIRQTIKSVLRQTFSDFEVIVVNDGSQDATLKIVSSIKDSRIKVFSYANAGVSISRNRGINLATGEFIAFLDADDLWSFDKLEAQLKALRANHQAAVAYSWTDYIDESGKFLHAGDHITVNGDVYEKLLLKNFIDCGSNPLIRREALLEVGKFDESLTCAEDWDLWLRLAVRYHFVAVPRPQVLYRICNHSASANIYQMEVQGLKFIEKAFSQAPETLQHLKKRSISNFYHYLTMRVLECPLTRMVGLTAARCFWHAIISDTSLFSRRSRLMSVIFLKIVAAILLPDGQAQAFLKIAKIVLRKLKGFSKVAVSIVNIFHDSLATRRISRLRKQEKQEEQEKSGKVNLLAGRK